MKVHHIALWTFRLEELRAFYVRYFGGRGNEKYVNPRKGFESYFSRNEARQTSAIITAYENPEDINSSPEGAPSKRLLSIKPDYNKVLEGNLIALEIGIHVILEKCPRFAEWMNEIVKLCTDQDVTVHD